MSDINSFREKLGALISKFEKDRHHLSNKEREAFLEKVIRDLS